MTKTLVVPFLALGIALYGCGSDNKGGTAGSDGSVGGTGGSVVDSAVGGAGGSVGGAGGSVVGGAGGTSPGVDAAAAGKDGSTTTTDGSSADKAPSSTDGTTSTDGTAASGDKAPSTSEAGSGVDWTDCPANGMLTDVSVDDFCAQYMKVCKFDATGGAATMERFKSLDDCKAGYSKLVAKGPKPNQACVAYHLCAAGKAGQDALHCPHPVQATFATPTGPCAP